MKHVFSSGIVCIFLGATHGLNQAELGCALSSRIEMQYVRFVLRAGSLKAERIMEGGSCVSLHRNPHFHP